MEDLCRQNSVDKTTRSISCEYQNCFEKMKKEKLELFFHLLLLILFLCSIAQAGKGNDPTNINLTMTGNYYIYISDTAHGIVVYKLHPTTGDISFIKIIDVGGQPGSLTVDPTHSYLYAAIRSTNSISSFKINSHNGDVAFISTLNVAMNPVYIKTDKTGKFLLAADNNKNKVSVFLLGKAGEVQSGAIQEITTADFPHSIQVDPTNRFWYIPCRTGETIQRYSFDSTTGIQSANSLVIATPDSTGPRILEFHPALQVIYCVNEFGRSVTVYRIDTLKKTLSAIQTLSLIPPNIARPIAPNKGGADIHLTPDNRFLYASNRDPDNIVAFSVDASSGMLTLIAQYALEGTPRAFDIDPTGKFIYVGGQTSGKLTVFRIDTSNGKLIHLHTYDVGESLVWVFIVQMDAESSTKK